MTTQQAEVMMKYLLEVKSRLYKGRESLTLRRRRLEWFNLQCTLWRNNDVRRQTGVPESESGGR